MENKEQSIDFKHILNVATEAGCIILQNGGEIYRVEDTMEHISRAFGAKSSDSYATPTTIMLTIYDQAGKPHTTMKRIHRRGVNLSKVAEVNRVSRSVACKELGIEETQLELARIAGEPGVGLWAQVLASAAASGAFTLVFGGLWHDILPGAICGAALRLAVYGLQRRGMGQFFVNMAGGAMGTFVAWVFFRLNLASGWTMLAVSTLMLLVPGLLFTNGFRDIVSGDLVSGVSRTIEAITMAAALACGAAMVYYLLTQMGGGVP